MSFGKYHATPLLHEQNEEQSGYDALLLIVFQVILWHWCFRRSPSNSTSLVFMIWVKYRIAATFIKRSGQRYNFDRSLYLKRLINLDLSK